MKRITITGNIGCEPTLRLDKQGQEFVTFTVAVNVGSKANPRTDWVDISCGGKLANVMVEHAVKGDKVLVDGFPHVNAYINKDNNPVAMQRVYAHTIELLTRGGDNNVTVDTIPINIPEAIW